MSEQIKDGGQAFPLPPFRNQYDGYAEHSPGMSLRDYFAAKAMMAGIGDFNRPVAYSFDEKAAYAYEMADAMLKAREA